MAAPGPRAPWEKILIYITVITRRRSASNRGVCISLGCSWRSGDPPVAYRARCRGYRETELGSPFLRSNTRDVERVLCREWESALEGGGDRY